MPARHPFSVERDFYGEEVADRMMHHALLEQVNDARSADEAFAAIKLVMLLIDILDSR